MVALSHYNPASPPWQGHGGEPPEGFIPPELRDFGAGYPSVLRNDGGLKRNDGSNDIEPMPKDQLDKIVKAFEMKGSIMQMDAETDAYLRSRGAEAMTYDELTILLMQNPGRAAVFEELIHAAQFRNGEISDSAYSKITAEIRAHENYSKIKKHMD